jgi:hypothetical protein
MRRIFLPLLLVLLAMPVARPGLAASAALPGVPDSGRLEFGIFRDGDQIGRQVSTFRQDGDGLVVSTEIEIAVKVLLVTAFRFEMHSEEHWVDGKLVALRTRANDDGKRKSLEVVPESGDGQMLRVTYNGRVSTVPLGRLPASFWNPATVEQSELVDVLNGKNREVTVTPQGGETLTVAGHAVQARRYSLRGDLQRDLWYGPDGGLLKVALTAEDGSTVTFIRKAL